MAGYHEFSQSLQNVCDGLLPELTKAIDGYEISLRSMLHGYYVYGKLPIKWNGSEQDLHRQLRISMSCFNNFDASLALGRDNTLYVSQYIAKPRTQEDLLLCVESLINLIDVWVEMDQNIVR